MQLRDHAAVQSKRDYFTVDPRELKIDAAYNVRDLTSPETLAHIEDLKASIAINGVRVALEVRLEGEDIYVVAGHCRHAAVMELIAEGNDIKTVPAIPEPKNTSVEERTINLAISNSGKPLKPLEVAKIVRRLIDWGWSEPDIATKLGWKSRATVQQHLEMMAMPEAVKEQVRQGDVSATLAKKIVKETRAAKTDPEFAAELIAANKAENARIRGKDKRHKVTAKTIKRDQPKLKAPVATPEQIAEVLGDPLPQLARGGIIPADAPLAASREGSTLFIPTPEATPELLAELAKQQAAIDAARAMTDQELVDGLATHGYHVIGDEKHEAVTTTLPSALAGTQNQIPQRNGIKELIEALEPFANLAHEHDFNERSDDDVVEVAFKHLKKAWIVFAKVTGALESEAA